MHQLDARQHETQQTQQQRRARAADIDDVVPAAARLQHEAENGGHETGTAEQHGLMTERAHPVAPRPFALQAGELIVRALRGQGHARQAALGAAQFA